VTFSHRDRRAARFAAMLQQYLPAPVVRRRRDTGVPAGHDARWATWAVALAEAARDGASEDELIAVGVALGFTRTKADNIVCWLQNEGLITEGGEVSMLTLRGRRYLLAHQAAECGCFVCAAAAANRAWAYEQRGAA
jgi:urease gamma subunit